MWRPSATTGQGITGGLGCSNARLSTLHPCFLLWKWYLSEYQKLYRYNPCSTRGKTTWTNGDVKSMWGQFSSIGFPPDPFQNHWSTQKNIFSHFLRNAVLTERVTTPSFERNIFDCFFITLEGQGDTFQNLGMRGAVARLKKVLECSFHVKDGPLAKFTSVTGNLFLSNSHILPPASCKHPSSPSKVRRRFLWL